MISGLALDRYLRERIFDPLGMVDTGFSVPEANISRLAASYAYADGGFTLADDPRTSAYARPRTFLSGVAGLVSTAGDYLRFCRMLAGGGSLDGVRIIGPRTLRFMTTNHLPDLRDLASMADSGGETRREGQGFGLGFGVPPTGGHRQPRARASERRTGSARRCRALPVGGRPGRLSESRPGLHQLTVQVSEPVTRAWRSPVPWASWAVVICWRTMSS